MMKFFSDAILPFIGDFRKRAVVDHRELKRVVEDQLEKFTANDDQSIRITCLIDIFHKSICLLTECSFNFDSCMLTHLKNPVKSKVDHDTIREKLSGYCSTLCNSEIENTTRFTVVTIAAVCFNEVQNCGHDFAKLFDMINKAKINDEPVPVNDIDLEVGVIVDVSHLENLESINEPPKAELVIDQDAIDLKKRLKEEDKQRELDRLNHVKDEMLKLDIPKKKKDEKIKKIEALIHEC